jgi:hypothetical protein
MTVQEEKKSIVMEKPVPPSAKFVGFEIEKEDWDKYKLLDGSLLKARFILTGILMDKTIDEIRGMLRKLPPDQVPKIGFGFRSQYVFTTEPPQNLRGTPDGRRYSVEELRNSIVKEDIDFETLKSTWNSYRLENGITVKCRLSPTVVSRTNKFDEGGMPIYVIDSTIDVKVTMPEDIEKILQQRKKSIDKKSVK